jgi:G3E family GTPase
MKNTLVRSKKILSVTVVCGLEPARLAKAIAAKRGSVRACALTSARSDWSAAGELDPGELVVRPLATRDCACGGGHSAIPEQIAEIAKNHSIDHLFVECDSSAHPIAFASLFAHHAEHHGALSEVAKLNAVVTAVDPQILLSQFFGRSKHDAAALPCALAEQIEFADIILLEKNADVEVDSLLSTAVVTALNPRAKLMTRAETAIAELLDHNRREFDIAATLRDVWWRQLLNGPSSLRDRRGSITGFLYRARRPFHPERFWDLLQNGLPGVFRAKGFFWLATRMNLVGGLNIAGFEHEYSPAGEWWAAIAERNGGDDSEIPEVHKREWIEPFGDRRQAISLMGFEMNPDDVIKRLDQCLLTDVEMTLGEHAWASLPDPFPSWTPHSHSHEHEHEHEHHECCEHH